MKKKTIFFIWLIFVFFVLTFYFFNKEFFWIDQMRNLFSENLYLSFLIYFILWSLRGFTLVPLTPLLVAWIVFLPALPLFFVNLLWVLASSSIVYFWWKYLWFDKYFNKKYSKQMSILKKKLEWKEYPVIILWSLFPFSPTDLICYIWEIMNIKLQKILLWIMIWEWIVCGIYIFWWEQVLKIIL